MKSAQIDRVTVALDSFRIEAPTRVKRKIEATLQTVTMAQELYAKASLADRCELASRQTQSDGLCAELLLAFATDVRPAIELWRTAKGLPRHSLNAFRESGYLERITRERSGRPTVPSSSYA
jgi:L-rhamnose isomerase/sugar isomerase